MELMMAVSFSVLLMTGIYGFYNASNQVYNSGVSEQNLQTAANIVLSKIIEGETESGVVYRLSTAASYMIPNGTGNYLYSCGGSPRATPCNASNLSGELYYCQDSPCGGYSDPTARWYYLNSGGTSVIYHHPKSNGGTVEETIYTAPAGSTLTLRFSPAQVGTPLSPSANVVEIDVDLTSGISISRLATCGDASTFVLLRDHP